MILRHATMSGLGECPQFAPYATPSGGCSNVPPGVSTDPSVFTQTPFTRPESLPGGYMMNPVTGVVEKVYTDPDRSFTEAAFQAGAAEANRQAAEREAAEAQRQGAARGLNVVCEVHENCSPIVAGGSPTSETACLYYSECSVNGYPGNDAGLLIRPGGFEIAVTEAARAAGTPLRTVPQLKPSPMAVPYERPAPLPTPKPPLTPAGPPPEPSSKKQPTDARSGPEETSGTGRRKISWEDRSGPEDKPGAGMDLSELAKLFERQVAGFPLWMIAAAAGAGLYFFSQRGKR